jgi:PAS domain S-box-containing protein
MDPVVHDLTTVEVAERRLEGLSGLEERYRALVEQVPAAVYIALVGDDGDWLYISPQIEALTGWTPDEWLAHPGPFAAVVHTDDRDRAWAEEDLRALDGQPYRVEYRVRHRDGRELWVHDDARIVHDGSGRPLFWQGLMTDITERKRLELERSALLDEILRASERERQRVAAQIHDGPIQHLTALLLQMESARRRMAPEQQGLVEEQWSAVERTLGERIEELRDVMTRLRPPVLDQIGLAAAISQAARDLVPSGPPDVKLAFDSVGRLPQEVETALYRVAVEALTNALHHAHASEVRVSLTSDGHQLVLRIEDDGTGIRPDPFGPPSGFGLAAMRHRVESLGGAFSIDPRHPTGTTVTATARLG